jgi:bifunctional UDP-N-acetylglucosamine pyrophosphorylase/glucosamine-1-phosphate N-acetyltransferase
VSQAPPIPSPPDIVILAAGEGKRMVIGHPKALHQVFFRPMLHYVLDAAMAVAHRSITVVVGRAEQEIREQCRVYPDLAIIRQEAPSGTADAVRAAEANLGAKDSNVLILYADTVLMTAPSLQEMLDLHTQTGAACTVGKAALGRSNACAFCFRSRDLSEALRRIAPRGSGDEAQLEDALPALNDLGARTGEYLFFDPSETIDINDQHALWRVETVLQERVNRDLMIKGVAMQDPRTTLIDPRCRIDREVRIEGGCTLINSVLGAGVLVEKFCRIVDSEVDAGTHLKQGTCVDNSRIGRDCRIGNSVEIKNSSLGAGTRAAHQSFIEDADVGSNVTIGCGFITCNSTGRPLKRRTIIGDNVFIGSASQAIAPVTLGAGCFIATGTSVTEDVPPDAFVISRGRQVVKAGYAKKYGKTKGTISTP